MLNLPKKTMNILAISLIATSLFFTTEANAHNRTSVRLGILNCTVASGVGLILGSRKKLTCIFKKNNGIKEHYIGVVKNIGLDIGVTKKVKISWSVFAPPGKYARWVLAGTYGGTAAKITLGGGIGDSLLIGGYKSLITLQPLSVQVQEGSHIAAGIGSMSLQYIDN